MSWRPFCKVIYSNLWRKRVTVIVCQLRISPKGFILWIKTIKTDKKWFETKKYFNFLAKFEQKDLNKDKGNLLLVFKQGTITEGEAWILLASSFRHSEKPRSPYWRGRLSTVDIIINIACFFKEKKIFFSIKISWSTLVNTRRPTVLILPFGKHSLNKCIDKGQETTRLA